MSQQITKIKSRIKTVSGALKVTSAMKLVSTVKLNRYKNKMLANREYSSRINEISDEVLKWSKKKSKYSRRENDIDKKLYVIVSSTLGLCGAYNTNVFKLADATVKENDNLIVLGKKGLTHYNNGNYQLILDFSSYNSIKDEGVVRKLSDYLINQYLNGNYSEIHLIYSSYRNSLAFVPNDVMILPIKDGSSEDELGYSPILEPTEEILLDQLVPLFIKTTVYSKLLESEVCEQAARCNAMESATDNANEILDALQIEFNKARQAAITQEITEIVGAAEAL